MKRKIIIIFSISLFVFITIFLVFSINKKETLKLTTFKKSYSIVSEMNEKDKLEILLYISTKDTSLVNKKEIFSSCITDNEDTLIPVRLNDIVDLNYSQMIKGDYYHLFNFVFDILLKPENELSVNIQNAYLQLEYGSVTTSTPIGSMFIQKVKRFGDENNNLSISRLKAVVNENKKNKTISGIAIELSNRCSEVIAIKDIKLLNESIGISNNEITSTDFNFNSDDSIEKVIKKPYSINEIKDDPFEEFDIYAKSSISLIIPLYYIYEYPINSIGIKVTYVINGEEKNLYFDDFVFFKDNYITYLNESVNIQTYDCY